MYSKKDHNTYLIGLFIGKIMTDGITVNIIKRLTYNGI